MTTVPLPSLLLGVKVSLSVPLVAFLKSRRLSVALTLRLRAVLTLFSTMTFVSSLLPAFVSAIYDGNSIFIVLKTGTAWRSAGEKAMLMLSGAEMPTVDRSFIARSTSLVWKSSEVTVPPMVVDAIGACKVCLAAA